MMDYEEVNRVLQSFSGYSPALPPIINSTILTLFRGASDPDRPMRGPERSALEQNYELSLSVLHQFVQNSPHERAVNILLSALRNGSPFALYLRNFGLGAIPEGPRMPFEILQDSTVIAQDFIVKMQDDEFQASLIKHVTPMLPVLAVENGTFEFHRENDLPRLSLSSSSWQSVVARLVESAAVIFLFVENLTAGIESEIAMIRAAQRQASTVVVFATGDLSKTGFDDFPITAIWDVSRAQQVLAGEVGRIDLLQETRPLDLSGLILDRTRPPEHVSRAADTLIHLAFSSAGFEMQSGGSMDEAIDNLILAIASSFWSDNVVARGVAYKRLAMAQYKKRKINLASANLQRFLDIVERSGASGAELLPVLSGLEDLVHELEQSNSNSQISQLGARFSALRNLAGT